MSKPKVVVVMPAYNAEKTLRMTYAELPHDVVDLVILVDDGSSDETLRIARDLKLEVFVHDRNYGYGANQKTCYREALRAGADIVVMVHPDYQYDPALLPEIIRPIEEDRRRMWFSDRAMLGGNVLRQGMPLVEIPGESFSHRTRKHCLRSAGSTEYHTGYRAYRRDALESVNLEMNSDQFVFDQEIIAQLVDNRLRIAGSSGSCSVISRRLHPCSTLRAAVTASRSWVLARYACIAPTW